MRKLSCFTLMVIVAACALSFVQFAPVANAIAVAPWIATYNAVTGAPQTTFDLGEPVNITAYANYAFSIQCFQPGTVIPFETLGPFTGGTTYSAIHHELTGELGWWTLVIYDVAPSPGFPPIKVEFGVGYFNVVPFAPLGVIGILGVCFGVTGFKLRKRE